MSQQPWQELGISRATYFRHKAKGSLSELTLQDHKTHLEAWHRWRDSGLNSRPRSPLYKGIQDSKVKHFLEFSREVSVASVRDWLMTIPPIQHSKRQDMHSAISSFAKYLHQIGELSEADYMLIRLMYPKQPAEYEPLQRVIYREDVETILEAAKGSHSGLHRAINTAVVIFLSETALRASEFCNLRLSDLQFSEDPTRATVHVWKGKGGKSRLVPFSRSAQVAIQEYLASDLYQNRHNDKHVLWTHNPKHGFSPLTRDSLARRCQSLSEKTGIPFSAHSFRHYRITQWANNPRIPITVTQKWAGHSSLSITQRYIHIRDEDALKAAFE